jgi:MFS family permease
MSATNPSPWRALLVTCLTTAGWAFSFGLGAQVLTLDMDRLGWSDTVIGLNTGIYYLGIALAAILIPAWMRRWGKWCPVFGMVSSGLTLALFPWTGSLPLWFVLRFVNGITGAMSLLPLETWLSQNAPANQRSQNFAWYAVALTLGGAIGIGLGLPLFQVGPLLSIALAASVAIASGLILARWLPRPAHISEAAETGRLRLFDNTLSYGSAWAQGFLEGGMLAFLSLYLLGLGLSADSAGWMMGISLAGVIIFQVPAGWLADRLGRRTVLLGCYALVVTGLAVLPWCTPGPWLAVWLFLVGASSGAFYPLGLSLLGERVSAGGLSRAYAFFMALECIGSVIGPVCMGQGRDLFGEPAMFGVGLVAVSLVLLVCAVQNAFHFNRGARKTRLVTDRPNQPGPQPAETIG